MDGDFSSLHVSVTYNLAYNAAFLVEQGMGSMITYDRLVPCGTEFRPDLVFCPFVPALHSGNFLVWKKDRIFFQGSRTAEENTGRKV